MLHHDTSSPTLTGHAPGVFHHMHTQNTQWTSTKFYVLHKLCKTWQQSTGHPKCSPNKSSQWTGTNLAPVHWAPRSAHPPRASNDTGTKFYTNCVKLGICAIGTQSAHPLRALKGLLQIFTQKSFKHVAPVHWATPNAHRRISQYL